MNAFEICSSYRFRTDLNLIFNHQTGILHKLENEVAKEMFTLAVEGREDREIANILSKRYDVSFDEVQGDVTDFLNQIHPSNKNVSRHWYNIDKDFDTALEFPLRMEIEVTALCNWNCGFCYNVWRIDPDLSDIELKKKIKSLPQKYLPKETAFRLLDELYEGGCFIVRYSGGETTLHPDLLEILEYGSKKKMYQVLFTNGHYLTPEYCNKLVEYNVKTVLISLHGDEHTQNNIAGRKNAYDYTIRGINNALSKGLEVVVEMTLVKDNESQVDDIIEKIYSMGVTEFRIMRYVGTGKNDEKYAVPMSNMLPTMKRLDSLKLTSFPELNVGWPCGQKFCTSEKDLPIYSGDETLLLRFQQLTGHCEAGLVWGSISYDGRLRHCPHSNVYHGDLSHETISSSWGRMSQKVLEVVRPRDSCSPCELKKICKGGCHLPYFLESKNAEIDYN